VTGTRPDARRHHDLPASAGVPYPHRRPLPTTDPHDPKHRAAHEAAGGSTP
jgi:hypothetical protein